MTTPTTRRRVLSIDGGGMRGVMSCVYLAELERRLDGDLRDHFDIIAGTSTGAILAAAIGMGRPIRVIRDLYTERGHEIFERNALDAISRTLTEGVSRPEYNHQNLGRVLQESFVEGGADVAFGDLQPLVMITAYDTITRQAQILKNARPDLRPVPVWELIKGSCAAPTFFGAHGIEIAGRSMALIDGGVFANNPAACALAEALRLSSEGAADRCADPSGFVVASFGNGRHIEPITLREAREWGSAEWIRPLIGVMMDGDLDTTGYICQSVVGSERWFRYECPIGRAIAKMDDTSTKTLAMLVDAAETYIRADDRQRSLDRLASLLE